MEGKAFYFSGRLEDVRDIEWCRAMNSGGLYRKHGAMLINRVSKRVADLTILSVAVCGEPAPELLSEAQALGISVGALYRAKEQSGDTIIIAKRGEKFSEAGKLSWWMIARTEPVMEENVN